MTPLYVELGVLIVTVVVLTVTIAVYGARLLERVYDRERAMDQHVKAVTRHEQRVTNEAKAAVNDAQTVREDARVMLERVERHFADPRVKRVLGE